MTWHACRVSSRPDPGHEAQARRFFNLGVFQYSRRALELVWATDRKLSIVLGLVTIVAGVLPAAIAWVGQMIVDAIVAASQASSAGQSPSLRPVYEWVALEAGLVAAMAGCQRILSVCQSLLRMLLGERVNELILEKAISLELQHFEDSDFYDKLTRARREASSRPLSLVTRTFGLVQHAIAMLSYGILLWQFSPIAVLILFAAGLPAFFAETKFSGDAFRLMRWRSPETRKQMYMETVLAREDYVKEVKIFGLGPLFLQRYKDIFATLFKEDRSLTLRRGAWGFALGLVATAAFYGAYAWVAWSAALGQITLGEMTMYLMVFKQGQAAVSASLTAVGGLYEDNLYLSTLYEYLDQPVHARSGTATRGPDASRGLEFRHVGFCYPNSRDPVLRDVNLQLKPGHSLAIVGENGSGKTTLIKLLARLYDPTEGEICLDGLALRDWQPEALRRRLRVVFQDFACYQLTVGENIGAGDVDHFEHEASWARAAKAGMASDFVEDMREGYHTQLGKWFNAGRELSGGQWQKIALSRAFMREDADILILDEPTAAMDAAAEARVFEHVRERKAHEMTILISHRFSTVRSADHIVVLDAGRIIERGDHATLMAANGRYARLFRLQAAGYQ